MNEFHLSFSDKHLAGQHFESFSDEKKNVEVHGMLHEEVITWSNFHAIRDLQRQDLEQRMLQKNKKILFWENRLFSHAIVPHVTVYWSN